MNGRMAATTAPGWVPVFAEIALWVTVVLTVISGMLYLWRNRRALFERHVTGNAE